MPKFIEYKDELINLDLVVKISKNQNCDKKNKKIPIIVFYGNWLYRDGTYAMISLLKFDNEKIRDETYNDICYIIANHFWLESHCIAKIRIRT